MEPIRGTYDLYEKDMLIHNEVVETLKSIAKTYDFLEIKTPIIEKVELFKRSTGDSSDVVRKEMYTFLDKGNREIALRPELTAGVVRSFLSNKIYGLRQDQYKYFYYGEAFRYERPQKGRYRQFYQFGVEMFGDETTYSDVEVISLAYNIIKMFNLEHKVKLKINTIGSAKERKLYNSILKNYLKDYKDDLCEDCKSRYELNPLRILDCKIDSSNDIIKNAPTLKANLDTTTLEKYAAILVTLDEMGIQYEEDAALVRGLDYYNDIVFEFIYDDMHTLIGGGRYDSLVEQLGGSPTPAIGFGIGVERLIEAFKEENPTILEEIEQKVDIVYAPLSEKAYPIVLKSMDTLRFNGVVCSCVFNKASLKGHLKEALKKQAIYLVIIGDKEIEDNEVTIKNLITKEEEKRTLKSFEDEILKIKE